MLDSQRMRGLSRLGEQRGPAGWLLAGCLLVALAHVARGSLTTVCGAQCGAPALALAPAASKTGAVLRTGSRLSFVNAGAELQAVKKVAPLSAQRADNDAAALVKQQSVLDKVGQFVKRTIAPEREYFTLIKRYHAWFQQRRQLALDNPSLGLKEPMEELKEEYARVDEHLIRAQCNELADHQTASKSTQTVDHMLEALKELIERLERKLDQLRQKLGQTGDSSASSSGALETDGGVDVSPEQVREAMERVKQTALTTAKNVIMNEASAVANIVAVHAVYAFVQSRADIPGDLIGQLAPMLSMLNAASTPVVAAYLRNVEFRAAMAVVRRVNPFACAWGPKKVMPVEQQAQEVAADA